MRNLPEEMTVAANAGEFHAWLALEIERAEGLHKAAQQADKTYRGDKMISFISMLRACDLAMWQMKEALGYIIPSAIDERYPRRLAGNGGSNPFVCGVCEARRRNPHLFVPKQFEVRVATSDKATAAKYIAAGFEKIGWDSAAKNLQPHEGFDVYRSTLSEGD